MKENKSRKQVVNHKKDGGKNWDSLRSKRIARAWRMQCGHRKFNVRQPFAVPNMVLRRLPWFNFITFKIISSSCHVLWLMGPHDMTDGSSRFPQNSWSSFLMNCAKSEYKKKKKFRHRVTTATFSNLFAVTFKSFLTKDYIYPTFHAKSKEES
jgi:hypothetical protein